MNLSRTFHSRKTNCILLVVVILLATINLAPQGKISDSPSVRVYFRVLFIGNSFTYYNNMPRLVEAISESVDGPLIKSEMVAIGGARLEDLWREGSALTAIRSGRWDFVVMNEQSALGGGIVNGEKRIGDPANFFKYVGMFDAEIRKTGAKTVVMMTWKDKNDPDRIQNELTSAFLESRNKIPGGVILAPVSEAWTSTAKTAPGINLYFADNHHPSKEGSYLVACTIYARLTRHSPEGAAAKIEGSPVEEEIGTIQTGKTKTLVNLSPRIATKLQQIAQSVVSKFPL